MNNNQQTQNSSSNRSNDSYYLSDFQKAQDNNRFTSTIVYSEKSNNPLTCSN